MPQAVAQVLKEASSNPPETDWRLGGQTEKRGAAIPENRLARSRFEKAAIPRKEIGARGSNQFGFAGPALHQLPNPQPTKNHNELVKH